MDLFNFVKNQVDIIATISEYTSLKKTGSLYWKGLCPFHHEKTPSFTVSPHKKIFYCFGCHETGDVINFIEKTEHISGIQAVQHLIQRYNLDVPESLESSNHIKQDRSAFKLCKLVAQWCTKQFQSNNIVQNYLKSRHFDPIQLSQFEIGFFPAGSKYIQKLLAHVLQHNFSSKDLIENNILIQGKGGLYSPFEDRIIFPIKDHLGQVCGFGGRIFKQDDQRPKYYNSRETNNFKKGKILFGLNIAKHEIQKQKTAFIVEGYTDCIAMYQHGYHNTVATLGTACSIDHLKQLAQHAQKIYILYDADSAGKKAILRLTQICWQLEMELKVVLLPSGQDPASALEQEESIDQYIQKSIDIFTFFMQSTSDKFHKSSMRDKMNAIQDLLNLIENLQDEIKKSILLVKAAETLQMPLDILKKEYNKRKTVCKQSSNHKEEPYSSDQLLEEQILASILHDSTILTKQHETLLLSQLSEPISSIITKIVNCNSNSNKSCSKELKNLLTPQELKLTQTALFKVESSNIKQTFENLMLQFQRKHWKSIISHIKMKLAQAKQANNTTEIKELLDAFENIKKTMYKNGRL